MSSVVQGSHALSSFKGKKYISPLVQEVQDSIYTCNVFLQRSLENTICHTYCLNEQRFKEELENREYLHCLSQLRPETRCYYFLNVFLIYFCLLKYFHCERMKSLPETQMQNLKVIWIFKIFGGSQLCIDFQRSESMGHCF